LKIDRLRAAGEIWGKMKMQNASKGLSLSFTMFQHPATVLRRGVKNAKAFTRILSEAPNEISLEATKADAVHVSARSILMAEHTQRFASLLDIAIAVVQKCKLCGDNSALCVRVAQSYE
jgi:hypothetical protein